LHGGGVRIAQRWSGASFCVGFGSSPIVLPAPLFKITNMKRITKISLDALAKLSKKNNLLALHFYMGCLPTDIHNKIAAGADSPTRAKKKKTV
jgi:hypothetical protein